MGAKLFLLYTQPTISGQSLTTCSHTAKKHAKKFPFPTISNNVRFLYPVKDNQNKSQTKLFSSQQFETNS